MVLKTTVTKENFNGLSELIQNEYSLNNSSGNYDLSLEGDSKLKSALSSERQQNASLKSQTNLLQKKIDEFNNLNMSTEEITELVTSRDKDKLKKIEEKGKYEQVKIQMESLHKKEKDGLMSRITDQNTVIRKERVNTLASSVCSNIGVPSDPILDRLYRTAKMDEKTLDVSLVEDGNTLISSREETIGQSMQIPEYIEDYLRLKPGYDKLFPATEKTGSGSTPNNVESSASTPNSHSVKTIVIPDSGVVTVDNLDDILNDDVVFKTN